MSTGNIGLGALADTIAEGAIARMQAGQPDRRLIRAQNMQSHKEAFPGSGLRRASELGSPAISVQV